MQFLSLLSRSGHFHRCELRVNRNRSGRCNLHLEAGFEKCIGLHHRLQTAIIFG